MIVIHTDKNDITIYGENLGRGNGYICTVLDSDYNELGGGDIWAHNRAYAEQQARELRKKVISDKKVETNE